MVFYFFTEALKFVKNNIDLIISISPQIEDNCKYAISQGEFNVENYMLLMGILFNLKTHSSEFELNTNQTVVLDKLVGTHNTKYTKTHPCLLDRMLYSTNLILQLHVIENNENQN